MPVLLSPTPITAVIYTQGEDVDAAFRRLAMQLIGAGHRLVGFVQRNEPRPGRTRCDMVLEDLRSGETINISEDRGSEAKGCRLDVDRLLVAAAMVWETAAEVPDLLVINKFGKAEGAGGGLRHLIVEALDRNVPVLVAVPWRNLDSWRIFSGGLSTDLALRDFAPRLLGGGAGSAAADGGGRQPNSGLHQDFQTRE